MYCFRVRCLHSSRNESNTHLLCTPSPLSSFVTKSSHTLQRLWSIQKIKYINYPFIKEVVVNTVEVLIQIQPRHRHQSL